ncbi:hypothetical protein ZIOFF_034034 [Zingiber officinale]|uniref:Pentatricopeptide repeat-containing protein n=1 Tax=Zingiber officinale TaxID=94328 RepID=A0A8J5L268_ZINOF|nr:hypothetical protein ZIOFF_034034 [Zingiber officinale]
MYGSRGRILDIVLRDGDRWSSPNAFALASCLKSYSVCGDLDFGQQLHGVVRRGLMSIGAVELFRTMESVGTKANHRTLASVASAASELGDLALCASLHASILKNGFETGIEVGNAILNMYMKNVAVGDGCVMFDTMLDHDTVSWNCFPMDFTMGMPVIKG